jgi:hypothetical protein
LREGIILFISASEARTILIPWTSLGNEYVKNNLYLLLPIDVYFNFQELKERNY